MAEKAKKFRSRFFRVAVEGATTDGRTIERQWLIDAAETYSPNTYGARVWMEHLRSMTADSPFRAYGDVVALKTEEVDVGGVKKLALFAQIEPTKDLVDMVNNAKQKLYTSVEITPNFADSGRAYMSGLAVTDTPASLGTEMLAFCAQNPEASPLKARKQAPDNLFSEAAEVELQFEEVEDKPGLGAVLLSKVHALLKGKQAKDDTEFAQFGQAVEAIAEHVKDLPEQFAQTDQRLTALTSRMDVLQTELQTLKTQLGTTQDHSQSPRPEIAGGGDRALTQF